MPKPINIVGKLAEISTAIDQDADRDQQMLDAVNTLNGNIAVVAAGIQLLLAALSPLEEPQAATLNLTLSEPEPN